MKNSVTDRAFIIGCIISENIRVEKADNILIGEHYFEFMELLNLGIFRDIQIQLEN